MRPARSSARSSLFLMELILAILAFSLCSAVCVRLFAAARLESAAAADLNRAVLSAQTAADSFKAAGGDPDAFCALTGAQEAGDGSLQLSYGSGWEPLAADSGAAPRYRLRLLRLPAGAGELREARVEVEKLGAEGAEPLYTLETSVYAPEGGEGDA